MSRRAAGDVRGECGEREPLGGRGGRQRGDGGPKPHGGDRGPTGSRRRRDLIRSLLEDDADITIEELRRALAARGHRFGFGTIQRFFPATGITRKKRRRTPPSRTARTSCEAPRLVRGQTDLDPERLVFIDETWATTKMARSTAARPRGERCAPRSRTATGRRPPSSPACASRHGRAHGARRADQRRAFESLCRAGPGSRAPPRRRRRHGQPLQPQGAEGPRDDRGAGAELLFLPPYSPDFNPIENAFAKLKALLRKAAERTVDGLWNAIGRIADPFTPTNAPITSLPLVTIQTDRATL